MSALPFDRNSNNFVFDNQMIAQAVAAGARIGELSCPTRYFDEASSINLRNSIQYGLGVLRTCVQYRLQRSGLRHYPYLEVRPLAAPAATPAAAEVPVGQPGSVGRRTATGGADPGGNARTWRALSRSTAQRRSR